MKKPTASLPPQKQVIERYDYHEQIEFLEEKYNFNSRDYHESSDHFDVWAKANKKPKKDPDGKVWSHSQIFWQEYKDAPDGYTVRPPYSDFWHWLIDHVDDMHNGAEFTFCAKEWLEKEREEDGKEFVITILEYFVKEFGDEFEVITEW